MRQSSLLNDGDSVMCRISMAHPTALGDAWFSWGATTTVRPGEDGEEVADRLYEEVTSHVYELIDGVTETAEAVVEQKKEAARESRRSRRIPTSGSGR